MKLGYCDILTEEQSKKVVQSVDKLEKLWIRRAPVPMDFFTVGAVTYMEGVTSIGKYHKHREVLNPVLKKHFGWVYDILCEKFSELLGDPVELDDKLAYPGFHVFGHKPGQVSAPECAERFTKPLASLHVDIQYRDHMPIWKTYGEYDLEEPFSFTLPLELPTHGGGLFVWDWMNMDKEMIAKFNFQSNSDKDATLKDFMTHAEDVDFKNRPEFYDSNPALQHTLERVTTTADEFIKGVGDPRDSEDFWDNGSIPMKYDPIYDTKPMVMPYTVGESCYHTGHVLHQIVPGYKLTPGDRRVTLQGHAVRCDGIWRLYF